MNAAYKWYVYELLDPKNNEVFYIGKGAANRIDAHEKEASNGVKSHKCNKIRSIWANGGKVIKNKVAYFNNEKAAYIHEADRISEYGLHNLTNTVLCCALVSDKTKYSKAHENAFRIIKTFQKQFATWVRLTHAGKYKVAVEGGQEHTRQIIDLFYNNLMLTTLKSALKKEDTANKVKELLKRYKIELVISEFEYGA